MFHFINMILAHNLLFLDKLKVQLVGFLSILFLLAYSLLTPNECVCFDAGHAILMFNSIKASIQLLFIVIP